MAMLTADGDMLPLSDTGSVPMGVDTEVSRGISRSALSSLRDAWGSLHGVSMALDELHGW